MARRRKRVPTTPLTLEIEKLSHEGRGIAHADGKTVFVEGVLPGEQVLCKVVRRHSRFDEARPMEILRASPQRVTPDCTFYTICGGCSFQHTDAEYQRQHKQDTLLEQLQHISGCAPETVLPVLTGPVWGYRRRARLAVKYVDKKHKVLVGFREKYSPFVAEIAHCEVLHPDASQILGELQELIGRLSVYRRIPQIEVAVSPAVIALVIRHLDALNESDIAELKAYQQDKAMNIYLQSAGLDSVIPLDPENCIPLQYTLPEHQITIEYQPTDFVQVNEAINGKLVNRALELLQPARKDRVLDLFCGLGNFSLPIARRCQQVTGVEGNADLVTRAGYNADMNQISNAIFMLADLAEPEPGADFLNADFDKILLDPPRSGAIEVIRQMPFQHTRRIVYISCNPATLARDAGILVNEKGFTLQQAGIVDMFPQTAHVESIALFTR